MALDRSIAKKLAAAVSGSKGERNTETRGTAKVIDGKPHVVLNGSTVATPVETTVTVNDGDELLVMVKNHRATVLGNITSNALDTATFYSLLEDGSLNLAVNNLDVAANGSITLSSGADFNVLAGAGVNLNGALVINPDGTASLNVSSFRIGGGDTVTDTSELIGPVGPEGPQGAEGPQGPQGPQGPAGDSQYVEYRTTGDYKGLNLVTDDGLTGVHTNINNTSFSILNNLRLISEFGAFMVDGSWSYAYLLNPGVFRITSTPPGTAGDSQAQYLEFGNNGIVTGKGAIISGYVSGTTGYLYTN